MELRDQNKKTEYGSIPKDWTIKSLNLEIDLLTGFPFPSSHYSRNGVRLLRGSNVKRGVTDWNPEITQYWPKVTPDLKEYLMNEGDIVVAMDGSLVGKSFARLSRNDVPSLLLQRVARIRSTKIDLGYLKEFVCSDYFTKYCDTVKTSSAIPHISPSDIRNFRIPVPPTKSEQTAIASALSDADALIASLEKLIAKKRLIKQGVMQKLLEPKKGWNSDLTKNLASINTGSRNTQDRVEDGMYHFFVRSDTVERIDSYSFDGEAILVAGDGVGTGKVIHYFNGKFDYHQRVYKISGFSERISGYFFYLYFKRNFLNRIMQMTAKSSVDSVRLDMIADMTIPFPSRDEQDSIVQVLMDSESEINVLETRLQKIRSVKQGMMQTLLTGKIRLV